jgi:hypothetical protein
MRELVDDYNDLRDELDVLKEEINLLGNKLYEKEQYITKLENDAMELSIKLNLANLTIEYLEGILDTR